MPQLIKLVGHCLCRQCRRDLSGLLRRDTSGVIRTKLTPIVIDHDEKTAYAHAIEVAGELMRNREAKCRSSRLQVYDESLMPCFEILFASIAITHLPIFPLAARYLRPRRCTLREYDHSVGTRVNLESSP